MYVYVHLYFPLCMCLVGLIELDNMYKIRIYSDIINPFHKNWTLKYISVVLYLYLIIYVMRFFYAKELERHFINEYYLHFRHSLDT